MEYTKEELEDIEYFRNMFKEECGEPDRKIEASQEVIKKYQDILPEELLYYWKTYGFSSFKDGLLWLTNPDDYKELVDEFLAGTQFENRKDLYAIARNAFGMVYLWESKKGDTLKLFSLLDMIFYNADIDRRNLSLKEENIEINSRIGVLRPTGSCDENDGSDKPLFQRCLKKFGKLEPDEIYAFKLSHFLGGADSIKNIQKANIFNHFSIQKQLKEPRLVISDLEKNILSY